MKKTPDETVELVAEDELTGKENAMRKFARDLETEATQFDSHVRSAAAMS
jgi:hypothetical protein